MIKTAHNSGQALLIILLVMAVALTIGLSVIARSITDIAISHKEEEAARAFSAAEAGVEQALLLASCPSTPPCDVTPPTVSTGTITALRLDTIVSGDKKSFVHPQSLAAGESASIWLVPHNTSGDDLIKNSNGDLIFCDSNNHCFTGNQLQFCWGKAGTESDTGKIATWPALEVMVIRKTASGADLYKIGRGTYDPNSTRRDTNKFSAPDSGTCTVSGQGFAFTKTVNLSSDLGVTQRSSTSSLNGPLVARVRLFYNSDQTHPLAVYASDCSGNGCLPQQGTKVLSTGTSGNASRKLEVYKLYADLPSIFDYGVFSGTGGIVK